MRILSQNTQNIWQDGAYIGSQAPMVRVTVQKIHGKVQRYNRNEHYSMLRWGQYHAPKELPNVASMTWDRTVDTMVNECRVTFWNTSPLPIGNTPETAGDLDRRGYYTPDRGLGPQATRWGYNINEWRGLLKPDRVLRTYEGFGFDAAQPPELDPNVYLTGTWLITDVEFDNRGNIIVTGHDLSRELQDTIAFPPVVPFHRYPLHFERKITTTSTVPGNGAVTGTFWRPRYRSDSGIPYYGFNGSIHGHRPSQAFDGLNGTYWLSVGNSQPGADYAFEFIEGGTNGKTINCVRGKVWGGPYKVYCSVKTAAGWQGRHVVPYNAGDPISAPNGANIPYVAHAAVDDGGTVEFFFKKAFTGVTAVRLTFTDLCNSGIGPYVYRAGVRELTVSGDAVKGADTVVTHTTGNYSDYTDIVKLFLSFGGFHWPRIPSLAHNWRSNGTYSTVPAPSNDPAIGHGRVWGDFMQAGVFGDTPLDVSIWDKKPLTDCIAYIRDILNFLFTIDYDGAVIWRSPNIWKVGNYVDAPTRGAPGYTSSVWALDERTILLDLTAKLSSSSMREKIFVANASGRYGAVRSGLFGTPNGTGPEPVNFRRVAGWTDVHFKDNKECTIMADLIALRQLMTYRTDRLTIVGYPGIQIDDQARIYERTSNEGWIHYISGIHASWEAKTRKYTYQLDTNWLGDTPYSNWAFDPKATDPDTQAYLRALGVI